jgi:hypothetical protein
MPSLTRLRPHRKHKQQSPALPPCTSRQSAYAPSMPGVTLPSTFGCGRCCDLLEVRQGRASQPGLGRLDGS